MKHRHVMNGSVIANATEFLLVALAVGVIGVGLYGPLRESSRLRDELDAARSTLDRLNRLFPLYADLSTQPEPADWPALRIPPRRALDERNVMEVPAVFLRAAAASGMELGAVSPKVQSDEAGRRHLRVEASVSGPYDRLRTFLVEIMKIPSLEAVEEVEIQRSSMQESVLIVARLALE
jgi:hypothetical protein